MRERRFLRRGLIALGLLGLIVIVSGLVLFLATRPTLRVVWQECQPPTVDYDGSSYCVSVIEGEMSYRGFPVYVRRAHNLTVTRGGQTDHGHLLDYRFTSGTEAIDVYIQRSTTEWTPDGVTFIEADGHRLFIPSAVFVGGR